MLRRGEDLTGRDGKARGKFELGGGEEGVECVGVCERVCVCVCVSVAAPEAAR